MDEDEQELLLITVAQGDYEVSYPVQADDVWQGLKDVFRREVFRRPPDS
jgi:hypothetical protein